MNNFNIRQADSERLGSKGALFDMIARKAPLLMKTGGGNLSRISQVWAKRTTIQDRELFVRRLQDLRALGYTDFKAREKISAETGFSAQTVWNYTGGKKPKTNLTKR